RNTANGPRMVVLPPRGPERIESSSARWAGASLSSARTGTRGGGIFLAGFLAGMGSPLCAFARAVAGVFLQQRLYDKRDHLCEVGDAPHVDVNEFLLLDAVNCASLGGGRDFVQDDAAEALAHVAVDQQH